jgi:hypothetical protein
MKQNHAAIKQTVITTRHRARKVGGLWIDPSSLPILIELVNSLERGGNDHEKGKKNQEIMERLG